MVDEWCAFWEGGLEKRGMGMGCSDGVRGKGGRSEMWK